MRVFIVSIRPQSIFLNLTIDQTCALQFLIFSTDKYEKNEQLYILIFHEFNHLVSYSWFINDNITLTEGITQMNVEEYSGVNTSIYAKEKTYANNNGKANAKY